MVQSIQISPKTEYIREVNQFMKLIHFKMEGTPTLEQLLMKIDYAVL
jgi:hypothetical protein